MKKRYSGSILFLFYLGASAFAADQDAIEESEFHYTLARTAQNRGNTLEAMEEAVKAFELNPSNARAGNLALETARSLKRTDVAGAISPKLDQAKRIETALDSAQSQIDWALRDLEKGRNESALARFEWVQRLRMVTGPLDPSVHDVIEEARYYSGVAHLNYSDATTAAKILTEAKEPFRQRSLFVLGNFYLQNNYLSQSLDIFKRAAVTPRNVTPESKELSKAASATINRLEKWLFEVHASSSFQLDSNVLGVPDSTTLTNDSPHSSKVWTYGAGFFSRSPINPSGRASIFFGLDVSESKALADDVRQLANTQLISPVFGAQISRFPLGRASLKYQYQHNRTKISEVTDVYFYHKSLDAHILSTDISRNISGRWDGYFSYHLLRNIEGIAYNSGASDRTGWAHGGSFTGSYRTNSKWASPSLTFGADWNKAKGEYKEYSLYSVTLANGLYTFSNFQVSASAGMDWTHYPRWTPKHQDRALRFGLYGNYDLTSFLALTSQVSVTNTTSTVGSYNTGRLLTSVGLRVSIN